MLDPLVSNIGYVYKLWLTRFLSVLGVLSVSVVQQFKVRIK